MKVRAGAWAVLAVMAATTLAYQTSFQGVFVFDDRPAILENSTIRSLSPDVLRPPANATVSGRPVANLTFALNYAAGPREWGFHAVNLGIHIAAALALMGVLRRTLSSSAFGEPARLHARGLALAIAMLWAVHPLTTGAVTYIVQRVESLMSLFYLLTLYGAIRAREPTWRRAWVVMSIVSCALGLATKEPMITAPIAVWLWDVVFDSRSWNPLKNRARRWLYVGLASTWLVTGGLLLLESQSRAVLEDIAASGTVEGWTPWMYLWTQSGVLVHYLRLALVPSALSIDYYGWPAATSPLSVLPQAAAMAGLFVVTVFGLFKRHPAGFAGAAFFLILGPTSSVIPISTEIAAEHRMYLPLAAVIALVIIASHRAAQSLPSRARTYGFTAIVVALAVAGILTTRARNRVYWSDEAVWADAVTKRPGNARARINYAIDLLKTNRAADAESQMRTAMTLPADQFTRSQVTLQLGSALCVQRRFQEGIPLVEQALALHPDSPEGHAILGQAYIDTGNPLRGVTLLRRGVDLRGDEPHALKTFTWYAATTPNVREEDRRFAIVTGERAVRLTNGEDVAALEALGAAYASQRRFTEALATARRALQLSEARSDGAATGLRTQIQFYESQLNSGQ